MTVDAMLDAAIKLLKHGGASAITTNRIAAAAGVSIGSVYQYFPNKHAVFAALHERHIRQVDEIMARKMSENEDASLDKLVEAWMDGMVESHAQDPELSALLQSEVPHRASGTIEFVTRLHGSFRGALAPHTKSFHKRADLDMLAFFTASMVDALGHAVVTGKPRGLSLRRAKAEACRAILGYLTA